MDIKEFTEEEQRELEEFKGTSYGRLLRRRFMFRKQYFQEDGRSLKPEIEIKLRLIDYPILLMYKGTFFLKRSNAIQSTYQQDQKLLEEISKQTLIPIDNLAFYSTDIKADEPKFQFDKREA
jgi:hypothetical protein